MVARRSRLSPGRTLPPIENGLEPERPERAAVVGHDRDHRQPAAVRAHAREGEEGHHCPAGQGDSRFVRPRDLAGTTRRRLAVEQLTELVAVDKKIKALTKELKAMVLARVSTLMELPGVGPVVAARILAHVGAVTRFADRNRFVSWTGTAPWTLPLGSRSGTGCRGLGTGR
jgi:transposase